MRNGRRGLRRRQIYLFSLQLNLTNRKNESPVNVSFRLFLKNEASSLYAFWDFLITATAATMVTFRCNKNLKKSILKISKPLSNETFHLFICKSNVRTCFVPVHSFAEHRRIVIFYIRLAKQKESWHLLVNCLIVKKRFHKNVQSLIENVWKSCEPTWKNRNTDGVGCLVT